MPTISITFSDPLNTSLQVGDTAYYVQTQPVGNFNTAQQPNMIEIGEVINVVENPPLYMIHVFNPTSPIPMPSSGQFIMFAKDRVVNTSGIIGYYADIKLVNHTTKKAEMFAISSGVIESSK